MDLLEGIESGQWVWVEESNVAEIPTRATIKQILSDNIRRNGILFGKAYVDVYYYVPGMVFDYWDNVRVVKDSNTDILECRLVNYEVAYNQQSNELAVVMAIYGRHAAGASGTFREVDIYKLS